MSKLVSGGSVINGANPFSFDYKSQKYINVYKDVFVMQFMIQSKAIIVAVCFHID